MRVAPVAIASWLRSVLTFLPMLSSIHMRAPPAPQHMPRVPLRGISTMSIPASEPIIARREVHVVVAPQVARVVVRDALGERGTLHRQAPVVDQLHQQLRVVD